MIRKIFTAVLALIFCVPVISLASKDYVIELKQEQKKLIKITAQITAEKKKLKKLAKEYEDDDKAMRQRLFKDKSSISEKEFIRESKMEQKKLRDGYYKNKKPLAIEYDRLKRERGICKRSIKKLTKKIDRLASDPDSEAYEAEIKELKSRIRERKEKRDNAITGIRENADREIAAITDMSKKSTIKKQILSNAKDAELELHKEYAVDKAAIVAKIDTARSEYKNNLKLWRMKKSTQRKEEQLKKIAAQQKKIGAQPVSLEEDSEKIINTNFTPGN
jgi:hypothetical protein